ncbi:MAG TPA: glycosyltransferase family 2 protein [Chthoniobacterales bacterium]
MSIACAPVIYIFFNRPELMRQSFAAIRAAQPTRLYLIADGPRAHKPGDTERCAAARAYVESQLDWPCEVTRDYSEINLGCRGRIPSGLTAAFAQLGEAIVIEDDIFPHPDFFTFCSEALARYRDNPKIHGISGFNPVSRYLPHERRAIPTETHITWGWASWHRAWASYREQLEGWSDPEVQAAIRTRLRNDLYFSELVSAFRAVEERKVDAWDFQWVYTMLYERRHAIVSSVHLVENLGFVVDATHTFHVPTFAKSLRSHSTPASPWPEADAVPDRLFDRIHWLVMLNGSRVKIAILRFIARYSRSLACSALRHNG